MHMIFDGPPARSFAPAIYPCRRELNKEKRMFGSSMTVGERLRAARKAAGLSIKQTQNSHVELAEENYIQLTPEIITTLANIYRVSKRWLETGVSEMTEKEWDQKKLLLDGTTVSEADKRHVLLLLEMLP